MLLSIKNLRPNTSLQDSNSFCLFSRLGPARTRIYLRKFSGVMGRSVISNYHYSMKKIWNLFLAGGCSLSWTIALATNPLPPLNLDPLITVSGLSSGGFMASQFHLAHAEQINGAAIISAGPYDCSLVGKSYQ